MAIKFVDIEPEDGIAKPRKGGAPASAPPAEAAPAGEPDAKLPLAKPEPKPRGRKKPLK